VTADVILVLLLAGGFVLGFFRGTVRQVLVLGAWLIIFVLAAYLRVPVAEWLAGGRPQFSLDYALMLSFLAIYLGLFGAALLLFEFGGAPSRLTRHPVLDDAVGGVLGLFIAAVLIAGVIVVLDTFYIRAPTTVPGELTWLRDVDAGLDASAVASLIRDWVVRGLGIVVGPLLPPDVRASMV
jgi:uncharacterized membrane protein required for colicin V production